jgi:hypothetical protein
MSNCLFIIQQFNFTRLSKSTCVIISTRFFYEFAEIHDIFVIIYVAARESEQKVNIYFIKCWISIYKVPLAS